MAGPTWIDIPATIGEGTDLEDFRLAVHLTIYWAQDMTGGPLWKPYVPPRPLANKLCRAQPLSDAEIEQLGWGRWPPLPEELDLSEAPKEMPVMRVKKGLAGWKLDERGRFWLRKAVGSYVSDVKIRVDEESDRILLRQTVNGGETGVPRNLKMISSAIGLYDGDVRLLPVPMLVHTPQDVSDFIELLVHPERMQAMWLIAQDDDDDGVEWEAEVERFAHQSFGLQHVVGATLAGTEHLRNALGQHWVPPGAIRTFNADFTLDDDEQDHPIMMPRTVREYGRAEALANLHRWRMARDARMRDAEKTS
jgi:hypothetical protein